ncbi:MAG: DNA mismatch repair endonuclease MutL [Planctomycetia bacterium]
MARIRRLDPHVVNQIAAGEVVERPSSVVKELVENALDAGARRIRVRLEDGGKALIEVADDGWGMDPDDLQLAFAPHATSKIVAVGDLEHVASLGFRGEALASIGSVSRARIVSRAREAASGHAIEDREGEVGAVTPAAAQQGTVVRVENLFGHVPARRKFLRTAQTEAGHVADLLERLALAWPAVGFTLLHGERTVLDCPPGEDRRARIERLHGPEVARALLHVQAPGTVPSLEGWISPPTLTRGDQRLQQVFLNGRHVRDKTVLHALKEAYRDLVPPGGRHPVAFLFLACDPARVDVNVHPAKAEVRWRDPGAAHASVRTALRQALEEAAPGRSIAPAPSGPVLERLAQTVEMVFGRGSAAPAGAVPGAARPGGASCTHDHGTEAGAWPGPPAGQAATGAVAEQGSGLRQGGGAGEAGPRAAGQHAAAPAAPAGLRPLGQALGTYLVFEGPEEIVLVDQHALHERVLFDRINARLEAAGQLEVQYLLVPSVVTLGAAAAARLEEEQAFLRTLGWVVEPFGPGALAVRGLPAVLRRPDPQAALDEVLEVLEQGRKEGLSRTALLGSAVDRMACRAAVMAGDVLHPDEVLALMAQAEALNHAHSCPHGRPTRLVLSRRELERWFHRTV